MIEKKIKIKLDDRRYVTLRFVFENDEWVSRASPECVDDMANLFGVEEC